MILKLPYSMYVLAININLEKKYIYVHNIQKYHISVWPKWHVVTSKIFGFVKKRLLMIPLHFFFFWGGGGSTIWRF